MQFILSSEMKCPKSRFLLIIGLEESSKTILNETLLTTM